MCSDSQFHHLVASLRDEAVCCGQPVCLSLAPNGGVWPKAAAVAFLGRAHNLRRKEAFRDIFRTLHGAGQPGVRVQLPLCAKYVVRAHNPSPDGHYLGHMDH